MSTNVPRIHFPNLMDFVGWHGTFVLVTIVIFDLLLSSVGAGDGSCPCTGGVAYGTAMLGLPAVSIFLVAFFSYFYQHDTQSPWKDLKAYFKSKQPCSYPPRNRNWEIHSGVFHQCTECQGRWYKIKITVSFFVSFVYPMLWLALGFRKSTYYACARVGPNPHGILYYCDNLSPPDSYEKNYTLAISKSLLVGNVLLVVVIVLASALFITYRVIKSKILESDDVQIEDNYDQERPPQAPINNFGHSNEGVVIPGSHDQMSSPITRSTEGPSPASGMGYEGFRERTGDMSRGRASSRDVHEPLIKVED